MPDNEMLKKIEADYQEALPLLRGMFLVMKQDDILQAVFNLGAACGIECAMDVAKKHMQERGERQ